MNGLFYLYGEGLPANGAWYSAPVKNQAFSAKIVRAAYRDAHTRYPRPKSTYSREFSRMVKTSMYQDRWVDASWEGEAPKSVTPIHITAEGVVLEPSP